MTIYGVGVIRRWTETHRDEKVHDYWVDDADRDEPLECEPVFEVRGGHARYIMFHRHNELNVFE